MSQVSTCLARLFLASSAVLPAIGLALPPPKTAVPKEVLHLEVYTADANSYRVTSTLVYGRTEAILVDAQFRNSDAAKLADRIAATGKRLKAIFITHPHPDHYVGMAVLLQRFPGTPIYMAPAGLDEFKRTAAPDLAKLTSVLKADAPVSLPTPELLPSSHLLLDGESVDVMADWQGDVLAPTNSFVWVPSLRAAIAGDLVFNGVHVWLPESNEHTRTAWRKALQRLTALGPRIVVAGHKKSPELEDTGDAVAFTAGYIAAFEAATTEVSDANGLVAAMKKKYPDLDLENILTRSAKAVFPK